MIYAKHPLFAVRSFRSDEVRKAAQEHGLDVTLFEDDEHECQAIYGDSNGVIGIDIDGSNSDLADAINGASFGSSFDDISTAQPATEEDKIRS